MEEIKMGNHEGLTKTIIGPDEQGYIFKHFKIGIKQEPYPIEEQKNILNKKKQYFGKFIPETELVEDGSGGYYIKQKFIKGKLLKDTDIRSLSQDTLFNLLELIKSYLRYAEKEGAILDITGYQEDLIGINNIRERRIFIYLKLYKGFLTSSNIIIADNGEVYMVDICDTIPIEGKNTGINNIKALIRNFIINMGIKNAVHRLNRLIKKKKVALHETLSMKEG